MIKKNLLASIEKFQNEQANSLIGQLYSRAIKELINLELSDVQLALLVAIDKKHQVDEKIPGYNRVAIPVGYLWTLISGKSLKEFEDNSKVREYMAKVVTPNLEKLQLYNLIEISEYGIGSCRRYSVDREIAMKVQEEMLLEARAIRGNHLERLKKPAPRNIKNPNKLPPLTVKTIDRLRQCKFRFDIVDYFLEGPSLIDSKKLNRYQVESLVISLKSIYSEGTDPQYHSSFHIQSSGRLHTIGGPLQMPSWFRHKFIKPVKEENILVELDLKCAQLLILCEILGCLELKKELLKILEDRGSVWPFIGGPLPKKVKKVIVYAFCFGAEMHRLPYLASRELGESVTKEEVRICFADLLEPLVLARENWLRKVSPKRGAKNELGFGFTCELNEPAKKKAGRYLAHLAQGKEQTIVQNLIVNILPKDINIVTYSYDGFTFEVEEERLDKVIKELRLGTEYPLEIEVIT